MLKWGLAGLMAVWARMASADVPPVETGEVGGSKVTFYALRFFSEDELTVLRRYLSSSATTLSQILPVGGWGAVAVAPEEGYLSAGGMQERSVVGVGGMASAESAATAALAGCNALRRTEMPCVVVLHIAPR
jgi:hypothetical protein